MTQQKQLTQAVKKDVTTKRAVGVTVLEKCSNTPNVGIRGVFPALPIVPTLLECQQSHRFYTKSPNIYGRENRGKHSTLSLKFAGVKIHHNLQTDFLVQFHLYSQYQLCTRFSFAMGDIFSVLKVVKIIWLNYWLVCKLFYCFTAHFLPCRTSLEIRPKSSLTDFLHSAATVPSLRICQINNAVQLLFCCALIKCYLNIEHTRALPIVV